MHVPPSPSTCTPTRQLAGPLKVLLAALTALALLLTGCSPTAEPGAAPSEPASSSAATDTFPRDVDVYGTTVHLEAKPEQIVVLGPSLTEIAFGVGAGAQLKAVDKLSNHPADAPVSDLDAFQPSAEAVAAHQPDLVLVSNDANDLVAGLTKLKIPVALLPAPQDLTGAYEQFRLVGELTGNTAAAEKLAADTQATIEQAVSSVQSTGGEPLSYYWELDPSFYSVTSDTFIGSVLAEFGLENIADSAPDTAGGYPQLSAEFIVDADPDVIFLADSVCCQQSPETVAKRPGWDVIRAVKDPDGVVAINDDIASRWGPRIGELATTVAAAVQKLQS